MDIHENTHSTNTKTIFSIYIPTYHFPEWTLDPSLWYTFEFDKSLVYYDKEDALHDVSTN